MGAKPGDDDLGKPAEQQHDDGDDHQEPKPISQRDIDASMTTDYGTKTHRRTCGRRDGGRENSGQLDQVAPEARVPRWRRTARRTRECDVGRRARRRKLLVRLERWRRKREESLGRCRVVLWSVRNDHGRRAKSSWGGHREADSDGINAQKDDKWGTTRRAMRTINNGGLQR